MVKVVRMARPRRRFASKPYKKGGRLAKPAYRRKRRIMAVPRFMRAVPQAMRCRLVWQSTYGFTSPGTTVVQNLMLYPNDLFDSTAVAGNQQSYMRDQLYQWYNFARCIKWSVYIKALATDSVRPVELLLGLSNGVPDTDINLAKQRKNTIFKMVNANQQSTLYLKDYVDKSLGNPKGTAYRDDAFQQSNAAVLGTDSRVQLQLLCRDTLGQYTNGATMCVASIKICQWCRFQDPLDNAGS